MLYQELQYLRDPTLKRDVSNPLWGTKAAKGNKKQILITKSKNDEKGQYSHIGRKAR